MAAALAGLTRTPTFRPAQLLALAAFDRDVLAAKRSTYLVAPPGSGKTVVGLELVRRLGHPALVLAPTTTIAAQWRSAVGLFAEDPRAVRGLEVATYQGLAQTRDARGELRRAALEALARERAAATGDPLPAVLEALDVDPSARDERELAARVQALKRAAAERGELAPLLAEGAKERMRAHAAAGVRTVVLDECHHLASLWGHVVAALVAELGEEVHVIGLTATAPLVLAPDVAALYEGLLGAIDVEVPTPAVVRDGHLAPYQELAWFTEPLVSERSWLGERHVRFAELLDRLHEPAAPGEEDLSFPAWVIGRIRHRDAGPGGGARLGFETFAQQRPDLARAGLRYLHADGLELPEDAPRGEGWREPVALEDWLVLLGDWATGCLRAHPGPAAERRLDELAVGLADLGFTLTRAGVRRGTSDVDRVLTTSQAKPLAAVEVLGAEAESRGEGLRAAILCDTEHGPRRPDEAGIVLAGGARHVLRVLGADDRTAVLRPLLVTGRTVACLPGDVELLAPALGAEPAPEQNGLVELERPGWTSAAWVTAAGHLLATGTTQLVVGTRGLLGEGWDAPSLNVLVDLTTVAADVSVRQVRGRALRLDPRDPEKVTSNWDVVCVAPGLARGTADWARFVRRHGHLHAPGEDGAIETGVSHVHAALAPLEPPAASAFAGLNRDALQRARDRRGARERWAIGTPYAGEDTPVLLVRGTRGGTTPGSGAALEPVPPGRLPPSHGPLLAFRLGAAERAFPDVLPLDRVAGATAEALAATGDVSPEAAASVRLVPRPGGVLRCYLASGTPGENAAFTAALDDVLADGAAPRWAVSRPVWAPGTEGARWRALTGRAVLQERWHRVPATLATHKERAEAFHAAWRRWVGPGRLLFAGRTDEGRAARAAVLAEAPDYAPSRRTLWR